MGIVQKGSSWPDRMGSFAGHVTKVTPLITMHPKYLLSLALGAATQLREVESAHDNCARVHAILSVATRLEQVASANLERNGGTLDSQGRAAQTLFLDLLDDLHFDPLFFDCHPTYQPRKFSETDVEETDDMCAPRDYLVRKMLWLQQIMDGEMMENDVDLSPEEAKVMLQQCREDIDSSPHLYICFQTDHTSNQSLHRGISDTDATSFGPSAEPPAASGQTSTYTISPSLTTASSANPTITSGSRGPHAEL
jgi:hypothetical protein